MFFSLELTSHAEKILNKAKEKAIKVTTAESCTGGLLSALLTEIAGSSLVFERGFVTYSNESKNELIGVKKETLEKFGAVSSQTVEEMALGALKHSKTDLAISITGIAGPDGGTSEKPVGLVYIGTATKLEVKSRKFNFSGDRDEIREATIYSALKILESAIQIL